LSEEKGKRGRAREGERDREGERESGREGGRESQGGRERETGRETGLIAFDKPRAESLDRSHASM